MEIFRIYSRNSKKKNCWSYRLWWIPTFKLKKYLNLKNQFGSGVISAKLFSSGLLQKKEDVDKKTVEFSGTHIEGSNSKPNEIRNITFQTKEDLETFRTYLEGAKDKAENDAEEAKVKREEEFLKVVTEAEKT